MELLHYLEKMVQGSLLLHTISVKFLKTTTLIEESKKALVDQLVFALILLEVLVLKLLTFQAWIVVEQLMAITHIMTVIGKIYTKLITTMIKCKD